jgi:hypothetical protein
LLKKFFNRLFVQLALAVLVGFGVFLLLWLGVLPPMVKDDADRITSAIAITGVLTIGAVAVLQLRKHIMQEKQFVTEQNKHCSERLTKAIEHFGSKEEYIQRGAIYELKRLAEDSERDREDICDILCGFIKDGIEKASAEALADESKGCVRPKENVFVAAKVMSALKIKFDKVHFSLYNLKGSKTNLSNIQLIKARLFRVLLDKANLSKAYLDSAELKEVDLTETNLNEAYIDDNTDLPQEVWDRYIKVHRKDTWYVLKPIN